MKATGRGGTAGTGQKQKTRKTNALRGKGKGPAIEKEVTRCFRGG
jgi:hypothetical protein